MDGRLFIGGAWREGAGAPFQSIDPATNEVVWNGRSADASGRATRAVDAARAAFADWAERPLEARIDAVKRYQAVLKDRA